MALVKIHWYEKVEYSREVEIDGLDLGQDLPNDENGELLEALLDLTDRTDGAEEGPDGTEVVIIGCDLVRAGDKPIEIKHSKPAYEADF